MVNTVMMMFSVRDLSDRFKQPTYDILFDDKSNNCIRCSFTVYDTITLAHQEASRLQAKKETPTDWDKVLT